MTETKHIVFFCPIFCSLIWLIFINRYVSVETMYSAYHLIALQSFHLKSVNSINFFLIGSWSAENKWLPVNCAICRICAFKWASVYDICVCLRVYVNHIGIQAVCSIVLSDIRLRFQFNTTCFFFAFSSKYFSCHWLCARISSSLLSGTHKKSN